MNTKKLYSVILASLLSLATLATPASLSFENFDIKAGEEKELLIDLNTPDDEITLVQFDLHLPEGISLKQTGGDFDIDMAGRTTYRKHSLDANVIGDAIRFLLSSSSNAAIDGTSGAVIKMTIVANEYFSKGNIRLDNILLVSPEEKETKPDAITLNIGGEAIAWLTTEPFTINPGGEATLIVDLNNPDDEITLVQFDLRLPDGLSIKQINDDFDIDMCDRTTWRKHSLEANATDGIIRFLLSSSSNTVITGSEGGIIKMTIVAAENYNDGTIVLEKILLVSPDEKEVKPDDVEVTTVTTGLAYAMKNNKGYTLIYSLTGQKLSSPKKGINIVGGKKILIQ